MSVPFLDLQALHAPIRAELDRAVGAVFDGASFILGPAVAAFEEAFAASVERRHAVGLNSGTSALHLALLTAGVGPGDEVVTTANTWVSTSWAIRYCGARPVFADTDVDRGVLDPDAAQAAITNRTKVLLPVDLHGNPADLDAFEDLAERTGVVLVDDAAQAHGARLHGRAVGSFGTSACFSFYPGKNLGAAGEAGALVTDDDATAERARELRDHAQSGRHHHTATGFNYRMEGVQGAVLNVKLPYLDAWNDARRQAADWYLERLADVPGLELPQVTPDAEPSWHLFVVRTDHRDQVLARLQKAGIGAGVHYPTPVHLQPAFADLGYQPGDLPHTERYMSRCLSLPMHPTLGERDVDLVCDVLRTAIDEVA